MRSTATKRVAPSAPGRGGGGRGGRGACHRCSSWARLSGLPCRRARDRSSVSKSRRSSSRPSKGTSTTVADSAWTVPDHRPAPENSITTRTGGRYAASRHLIIGENPELGRASGDVRVARVALPRRARRHSIASSVRDRTRELVEDAGEVGLHRLDADDERGRDLAVGPALGDERGDGRLRLRQPPALADGTGVDRARRTLAAGGDEERFGAEDLEPPDGAIEQLGRRPPPPAPPLERAGGELQPGPRQGPRWRRRPGRARRRTPLRRRRRRPERRRRRRPPSRRPRPRALRRRWSGPRRSSSSRSASVSWSVATSAATRSARHGWVPSGRPTFRRPSANGVRVATTAGVVAGCHRDAGRAP